MAHWQQRCYDLWFASYVMTHMAQWQIKATEMTTDITTEIKMEINTETTTIMPLPDQDMMVRYLIWSQLLGIMEEYQVTKMTALQMQHTMYLRVRLYIYPIKPIVNMCHKLLYDKIGVLNLCYWNMKTITSLINKKLDYIFDIYNKISIIACPYFSSIVTGWFPKRSIAKSSKIWPYTDALWHCIFFPVTKKAYSYVLLSYRIIYDHPMFMGDYYRV